MRRRFSKPRIWPLLAIVPDPLLVVRPDGRPANLDGLWAPRPAFLVCGGPSLNDVPLERLRDRGIVSLGVNQAAAHAPVRAWCFSDTHWKFHHGLWLDPAIMTFAPWPKLGRKRRLIAKVPGEGFRQTNIRCRDCPNTYGYHRRGRFVPEEFLTTDYCHWGAGGDQPADRPFPGGCLCTMLVGLRLLIYLGVRRIYLLGVDHRGRDGMCYGFADTKKERNRRYKWEAAQLAALIPVFAAAGVSAYNCSPTSALEVFPHVPWEAALADCRGGVPAEPFDTVGWYAKNEIQAEIADKPTWRPPS